MPLPSLPMNELDLRIYMLEVLSGTGGALGLTEASFLEAVKHVLLDYGAETVDQMTDLRKILVISRMQAWAVALAHVSADYNFADAGSRYDRGQMFDHIGKQYSMAMIDAANYLSDYEVKVTPVDQVEDPYEFHEPGEYLDMRR